MGLSDYWRKLRDLAGHALLQAPTVGVLVFNPEGHLLLVRSADDGAWGIPGGLVEPLERPEDAAVRETWEESGLQVELTGLLGVFGGPACETRYPNGDHLSWVASVYLAQVKGGAPSPDGTETLEVRFVSRAELATLPCRPHVALFLEAYDARKA